MIFTPVGSSTTSFHSRTSPAAVGDLARFLRHIPITVQYTESTYLYPCFGDTLPVELLKERRIFDKDGTF